MMRMAREGTKRWSKEMQVETKVCERGGKKTKKKRRTHAAKAHTDNILPFQLELKVSYIIVGRWLSSFSPQFLPLFLLLLTHTRSSFWLLRTQAMHFSQFPLRLNTQRERERAAFFICHFFFRHFHFIWCAVFFLARSPFFYKTICGFSFVWENLSHIFLSLLFPLHPRASDRRVPFILSPETLYSIVVSCASRFSAQHFCWPILSCDYVTILYCVQ